MVSKLRKKLKYIVILEIIVLFIMLFGVIKIYNQKTVIEYDLSKWTSDYISYENDLWYIDENILSSDEGIDLICGPGIELVGGVYWVTIEYECESDQSVVLLADHGDSYIRDNILKLSNNRYNISHRFSFPETIDHFDILVQYNGHGAFQINKILISQGLGAVTARTLLVFCFFLFILVDVYILMYEQICKNKKVLTSLLGITLLASLPLFYEGISHYQDMDFHLRRIEAITYELSNGIFPVKMSSFWNRGYGYPASIYYGDILLYIPAILRLCGVPVVLAYKLYAFLIHAGTTVISYVCFKNIWRHTDIALLVSLAYVTAGYRFVNVYVRAAVGEYSAMMFLPLLAMSIYKIYTDDNTDWKNYRKNVLWLCIGMSGIIGTHILTAEMIVITLFLICIVLWRKTFRKNTICVYVLAVVGTLLLNLYFIVPFLDYSRNVSVYVTHNIGTIVPTIQFGGTYIVQYMDFFHNVYGINSSDINERMQLTPGLVLMGALFAALYLKIQKKSNKEIRFFAIFSLLMLFVASNLFPWDALAKYSKVGVLLAQVRFPWRYITLAVLFLSLLMGCVIKVLIKEQSSNINHVSVIVIGTCIVMSSFFLHSYEEETRVNYKDATELGTHSDLLYLPVGTGITENIFDGSVMSQNMNEISIVHRKGTYTELYCETGILDGTVSLPVLNYKGYRIIDEYGTEYKVTNGGNNTIQFTLPAGFSGKVFVDFIEPLSWRFAEIISLLSILLFILYVYNQRRFKANKQAFI